jgi:hypothetical protein
MLLKTRQAESLHVHRPSADAGALGRLQDNDPLRVGLHRDDILGPTGSNAYSNCSKMRYTAVPRAGRKNLDEGLPLFADGEWDLGFEWPSLSQFRGDLRRDHAQFVSIVEHKPHGKRLLEGRIRHSGYPDWADQA